MMKKLKNLCNMRRVLHLLIVFTVIFWTSGLAAQNESSNGGASHGLSLGAKFGTVLSQFTDQQPYTNISQGVMGGVFCTYDFGGPFSVQLDVNYLQQGGNVTRFDVPAFHGIENWYQYKVENQNITMHNIEFPLLAQYTIPLSQANIIIGAGPAFSYNIGSGYSNEGTVFASETTEFHTYTGEENNSSSISDYEYSAIGSVGFHFLAFGETSLFVEGRYKYGLTNVYEGYSYVGIPQIQGDLKNDYMSIALGFHF